MIHPTAVIDETASVAELLGDHVPEIALFPDLATLALRTEWALRRHGTQ